MTTLTFKNNGEEWSAKDAADRHIESLGYSIGSMERHHPIGLMKGDYLISKWTRMTPEEHSQLDGTMESSDWRNGSVTVNLK